MKVVGLSKLSVVVKFHSLGGMESEVLCVLLTPKLNQHVKRRLTSSTQLPIKLNKKGKF